MENEKFLKLMQRYIANIAISGSTLRNQGSKDVAKNARAFLADLDLSVLCRIEPPDYINQLELWSDELKSKLPKDARNWGTARKALNVFLVQVFMNKYLADEYGLSKFGDTLETPLDSQAAAELRRLACRGRLPRWNSIKRLERKDSQRYQGFAADCAKQQGIPRACMDIMLWRTKE